MQYLQWQCNLFLGGVICVTLLDRLKEDQVTATEEMLKKWQKRVLHLAAMYIKDKLNGDI